MADFWAWVTIVVVPNVLPLGGPARTRQVRRSAAAAGYNGDSHSLLSMDILTEPSGSELTRIMPGTAVLVSILASKARTASPAATSPAAIPASATTHPRHHQPCRPIAVRLTEQNPQEPDEASELDNSSRNAGKSTGLTTKAPAPRSDARAIRSGSP